MKHFLHILGLEDEATWIEIRDGYKTQVKVWHPDRFTEDEQLHAKAEERTKEIHYALRRLEELKQDLGEQFDPTVPFLPDYASKTNGGNGTHGKATYEDRRMGYLAASFGNWGAIKDPLSNSMHRGAQAIRNAVRRGPRRKVTTIRKARRTRLSSGPIFFVGFACTAILSTIGAYNILLLLPDEGVSSTVHTDIDETEPKRELLELLLEHPSQSVSQINEQRARLELSVSSNDTHLPKLVDAAKNCQRSRAAKLLKSGVALNASDQMGQTALIWAAKRNCPSVLDALLAKGADPSLRSSNGFTAHRWAQWYRNSEALKVLESRKITR